MSFCKFGEICTPYMLCDYCKRERVAELEAKERSARSSGFFFETREERDERQAKETLARIERDRLNRRLAAEAVSDVSPRAAAIGIGVGSLAFLISAVAEARSEKKEEERKEAEKFRNLKHSRHK